MTKKKVVVTRRWPAEVEERLEARYEVQLNHSDTPMTAAELQAALQNADALLPTVTDLLNSQVLSIPDKQVKIIGNFGVGYNNIDIEAAKREGIAVTNTPHVLTDCTADIAMLLLLMTARRVTEGERLIRDNAWQGWGPTQLLGHKVTGKTLGLIGFGRIAQAMARKAHHGFGMKILCYAPNQPAAELLREYDAVYYPAVEDVLSRADFVSLHCPGGAATRHLINEERLRLMKPAAHLINTARGDVVDSKALIKALKEKWIAGAGLDVYEGEPHVDPGFRELEHAALLPHLGSATLETRIAMGNRVVDNIDAFFAGKEPGDRVA